ncbi:hypothetical protein PVAP13_3KG290027 [Panicum virgatum]|uniref:Uncharacterized protein n=1 Tax=Panicum virgatum TaxID=38727 RepID=A0A8T0UXK6_PANVG|nr:hypothetical protein PVAP13_3KG290027 [Panicum virgatum]
MISAAQSSNKISIALIPTNFNFSTAGRKERAVLPAGLREAPRLLGVLDAGSQGGRRRFLDGGAAGRRGRPGVAGRKERPAAGGREAGLGRRPALGRMRGPVTDAREEGASIQIRSGVGDGRNGAPREKRRRSSISISSVEEDYSAVAFRISNSRSRAFGGIISLFCLKFKLSGAKQGLQHTVGK